MSKSVSNSVKTSEECHVDAAPGPGPRQRHILRRHFSEDLLRAGSSSSPSSKPGPKNRLQKTGSRIFRELNAGHLLVHKISEGNLLKEKVKEKERDKKVFVILKLFTFLSF